MKAHHPSLISQAARAVIFAIFVLSLAHCSTNDPKRLQLGERCAVNSDCNAPSVCTFAVCHEQCASSRDCASGARCMQG